MSKHELKKKVYVVIIFTFVSVIALVSAAVFVYRGMTTTINVGTSTSGVSCVGFFTAGDAPNLPSAGTNANAQTYGTNTISVTKGSAVCTTAGGDTLYDSVTITVPITVGTWYIKDVVGFGNLGGQTVYVWPKVVSTLGSTSAISGYVMIYNASDGTLIAKIDVKTGSIIYGTTPITMNNGTAWQIDINLEYSATATDSFKLAFYVSQQSTEQPR
ncbi:hypothetical protein A3L04_06875 [Thermococcus chitonophagus]|uniref:Uncharacterized protein n=1 Tax=Thermococcus chitonophagus TaxID=54262 RepID=A0A160VU03_9EURY|nr:hypothetical protein [Thermococcus chitonophagus]ASJ16818.1 hypothetical protein A3L04_06875 [Thermococcus chitonophagus]CUX78289.1 hypothetical protein CHITON_1510 [Thermococcus chitonophagus]